MYNPRENGLSSTERIKPTPSNAVNYTSRPNRCHVIFCHFPKTYSYVPSKVLWLTDPMVFDPQHCHLLHKGRRIEPLSYIAAFQQGSRRFWYVEYTNGTGAHYKGVDVELVRSCLEETPAQDRFAYLRDVAELNPLKTDDGQKLLMMQYQKIDFVSDRSAAAIYLNPGKDSPRQFPCRCSSTPSGATPAREPSRQPSGNQIQHYPGPSGNRQDADDPQHRGQSCGAEEDRAGRLEQQLGHRKCGREVGKAGAGIFTALLGSRERKTAFVETQAIEKSIPAEIDSWYSAEADSPEFLRTIQSEAESLQTVFERQGAVGSCPTRVDGAANRTAPFRAGDNGRSLRDASSADAIGRLLMLWNELQAAVEWQPNGLFDRWRTVRWFLLKRRIRRLFDGFSRHPEQRDLQRLIPLSSVPVTTGSGKRSSRQRSTELKSNLRHVGAQAMEAPAERRLDAIPSQPTGRTFRQRIFKRLIFPAHHPRAAQGYPAW